MYSFNTDPSGEKKEEMEVRLLKSWITVTVEQALTSMLLYSSGCVEEECRKLVREVCDNRPTLCVLQKVTWPEGQKLVCGPHCGFHVLLAVLGHSLLSFWNNTEITRK